MARIRRHRVGRHVRARRLRARWRSTSTVLRGAPRPQGRLLNHAISSVGGSRLGGRSFVAPLRLPRRRAHRRRRRRARHGAGRLPGARRRVAPRALRPARCGGGWRTSRRLGPGRRAGRRPTEPGCGGSTWRRRRSASRTVGIDLHQVLGVVPEPDGTSGMPRTRDGWSTVGPLTSRRAAEPSTRPHPRPSRWVVGGELGLVGRLEVGEPLGQLVALDRPRAMARLRGRGRRPAPTACRAARRGSGARRRPRAPAPDPAAGRAPNAATVPTRSPPRLRRRAAPGPAPTAGPRSWLGRRRRTGRCRARPSTRPGTAAAHRAPTRAAWRRSSCPAPGNPHTRIRRPTPRLAASHQDGPPDTMAP